MKYKFIYFRGKRQAEETAASNDSANQLLPEQNKSGNQLLPEQNAGFLAAASVFPAGNIFALKPNAEFRVPICKKIAKR